MAIIQPLDLEEIFVNTIAEGWMLFMALAFAGFAFLAAKYRMPNQVFMILMFIFILFVGIEYPVFYAIAVLLAGIFIAVGWRKPIGG